MNRVVHFELLSRDPGATAAFYAEAFGWTALQGEGGYWRLITGGDGADSNNIGTDVTDGDSGGREAEQRAASRGINGATVRPMHDSLPLQTVNTIQVPDLDAYVEKVISLGGRVLSETIPLAGVGRFRYCQDPQGLAFGLIEYEESSS